MSIRMVTYPPWLSTLPTIRRGSSGPAVLGWQTFLKASGHPVGATGPDGRFGPETEAATKAWQSTVVVWAPWMAYAGVEKGGAGTGTGTGTGTGGAFSWQEALTASQTRTLTADGVVGPQSWVKAYDSAFGAGSFEAMNGLRAAAGQAPVASTEAGMPLQTALSALGEGYVSRQPPPSSAALAPLPFGSTRDASGAVVESPWRSWVGPGAAVAGLVAVGLGLRRFLER